MASIAKRRIETISLVAALLGGAACTTGAQHAPTLAMHGQERTITPSELVGLTEGLADSYVGTIADAINTIQADKPPPDIRNSAQRVKVFVGATAYSIATGP